LSHLPVLRLVTVWLASDERLSREVSPCPFGSTMYRQTPTCPSCERGMFLSECIHACPVDFSNGKRFTRIYMCAGCEQLSYVADTQSIDNNVSYMVFTQ
jgi:hypothetical protein